MYAAFRDSFFTQCGTLGFAYLTLSGLPYCSTRNVLKKADCLSGFIYAVFRDSFFTQCGTLGFAYLTFSGYFMVVHGMCLKRLIALVMFYICFPFGTVSFELNVIHWVLHI